MEQVWNRIDIKLDEDERMFVQTGCWIKPPKGHSVKIPNARRIPLHRIVRNKFWLFDVEGEEFSLQAGHPQAQITETKLDDGESLIINMDYLLALSGSNFLHGAWRFDLVSFIMNRFRYVYIPGPARVVYFGIGGVKEEKIENGSSGYDPGAVIGWTDTLAQGVSSRSSMLSAFLGKENICLLNFEGTGKILLQTVPIKRLPRSSAGNNSLTFNDYFTSALQKVIG